MRRARRASIIAALSLAFALLGGCSALKLGYGQADGFAFRWLDGYVDFDDAQSLRVRDAIGAWFAWQRRAQLADYADLLLRIEAEVQADTSAERVCGWWGEVRDRIERGVEQTVPALAEVASTLKPAQFDNIERRYAKSNAEYRDDFMQPDPARRIGAMAKRVAGRAEWLYGDLDRGERERIERAVAESPQDPQLSFDERRRRQQDGVQTLRKVAAGTLQGPAAQAEIRAWLRRIERSPREAYRLQAEQTVLRNCRLAADLHNATSAAQRQTASKKLKGWAADLRALAAEAGA
ncbi:MAG: DUF6279 family lipoprotein [Caldimonas sp.]